MLMLISSFDSGISVVISAPAIFRFTAVMNPERHLRCAEILGADVSNAKSTGDYAGNLLAEEVRKRSFCAICI
jgi:hydroxyacid-oxoacid transhydrogenase